MQPQPALHAGDVHEIIVSGNIAMNPVLQCIGIKTVGGAERFRLGLSDGSLWCSAMLATQLNHLVKDGHVAAGSFVRLDDYLVNTLQGKKLVIVLGMAPVGSGPTVGSPQSIDKLLAEGALGGPPGATATVSAADGGKGSPKGGADPAAGRAPFGGGGPAYGAPPPPPGGGAYGAPPGAGAYGVPPPHAYGGGGGGTGPIARAPESGTILPIASLNAYQNRWTIRGRVTVKSDVRHYSNARGEGKLFSFDLLDEHGGEIRCVGFGEAVDRWFDVVQVGGVYTLSKGSLKQKRPGPYNQTGHDLEITLDRETVIRPVDDEPAIPRMHYSLRKVGALADAAPKTTVDVAAVVESVGPITSIARRDGSEARKRNVTLVDDSGFSIELTLWGGAADGVGAQLEAAVAAAAAAGAPARPVLVAKSLSVGDYGGRTLSTIGGSALAVDPPDVPEAGRLAAWWTGGGGAAAAGSAQPLTGGAGGGGAGPGGGGPSRDRRVPLAALAGEAAGGRVAWLTVAGHVNFVRQDAPYYPACPGAFNGKACNKKMVEDAAAAGGYSCARCGHAGAPAWRYLLSFSLVDHTGTAWVTAFNEEAQALLGGVSAEELHGAAGTDAHAAPFGGLIHSDRLLKVKAFEEVYNDTPRVKQSLVRLLPLDYGAEAKVLLDWIGRVEAGKEPGDPAPAGAGGGGAPPAFGAGGFGAGAAAGPGFGGGWDAAAGGGGGASGNCFKCGQPGHWSKDCPSVGAGGPQGMGAGAPAGGFGGGGPAGGGPRSGACLTCGQEGHWARDCPSKRGGGGMGGGGYNAGALGGGGGGGRGGTCHKCGQPGHWARDCPGGGGGGAGGYAAYGGGGGGGFGGY